MKISIIIPAHNEEKYIKKCFDFITKATKGHWVETIVVLNRCTDKTEEFAKEFGAIIVKDESSNLSCIRNAGARKASGEILLTIDADSMMSSNLISEISQAIKTKKYIGGGVTIKPERTSLGLKATDYFVRMMLFFMGISIGAIWCKKEHFDKINGFDEALFIAEDLDLAKRLKQHGHSINKKFKHLKSTHIVTSCRKFDKFGDWHWFKFMFLNHKEILRGVKSNNSFARKYFYNFKRV